MDETPQVAPLRGIVGILSVLQTKVSRIWGTVVLKVELTKGKEKFVQLQESQHTVITDLQIRLT